MLIFTDGRKDYLWNTLRSAEHNLKGDFDQVILRDDSGDPKYTSWLRDSFAATPFRGSIPIEIRVNPKRIGFCETYRRAWDNLPDETDYVFGLEDDFLFLKEVDVSAAINVLELMPHLLQIAFMREPVNHIEREAGSLWRVPSMDEWQQRGSDEMGHWVEHRLVWTTNPSIYPYWVTRCGWGSGPGCEAKFSQKLFEELPPCRSAYWGKIGDEPYCRHIGDYQKGMGY